MPSHKSQLFVQVLSEQNGEIFLELGKKKKKKTLNASNRALMSHAYSTWSVQWWLSQAVNI